MDFRDATDETIAQAEKDRQLPRRACPGVAVSARQKPTKSSRYRRSAMLCTGQVSVIGACATSRPPQRLVALAQQLHGPHSMEHADALRGLCLVHLGLKAFPAARKAIAEAGHDGRAGPARAWVDADSVGRARAIQGSVGHLRQGQGCVGAVQARGRPCTSKGTATGRS
jgi:hypothetical protein